MSVGGDGRSGALKHVHRARCPVAHVGTACMRNSAWRTLESGTLRVEGSALIGLHQVHCLPCWPRGWVRWAAISIQRCSATTLLMCILEETNFTWHLHCTDFSFKNRFIENRCRQKFIWKSWINEEINLRPKNRYDRHSNCLFGRF